MMPVMPRRLRQSAAHSPGSSTETRLNGERDPPSSPFGHGLHGWPTDGCWRRWGALDSGEGLWPWLALRQTHVALGNFHIPHLTFTSLDS